MPKHRNRNLVLVAAAAAVAVVGVVVGLVATSSSPARPHSDRVAAYLTSHVPAGTRLAVVGTVKNGLPTTYPTVHFDGANLGSAAGLHYTVAPDPISSAGAAIAAYVEGRSTLVAVDPGRASLWAVGSPTPVSAVPVTSVPATLVPAPTVPATTAPATVPAPTVPAPTVPVPTVPAVPSTTIPPPTTSPPAPAPSSATQSAVTVQVGQSFWSIAQTVVTQRLGSVPTTARVTAFWGQLVAANGGHLPVPGNPNLIFPGSSIVVPPGV
jgi:hypothetical protein